MIGASFLQPATYSWPGLFLAATLALLVVQQVLRLVYRLVFVRATDYRGKHCVITGGSEGIGFEMAKALLLRGADVTVVARSMDKLMRARMALEAARPSPRQTVRVLALDVADGPAVLSQLRALDAASPVHTLIANAGVATTGYFLDLTTEQFAHTMSVNYMGVVHCAQALAPGMVIRRSGHIAIIGSAAGLCGMLGFTAYTPTKWALRGLADCLRQELLPYSVGVSICYPSDVQTPGYAIENLTKPAETLAMSDSGVLAKAPDVAAAMVGRIALREYHIGTDFLVDLLRIPLTSMSPRSNTILELALMPIVGAITSVIHWQWDSIVMRLAPRRPDVARLRAQ